MIQNVLTCGRLGIPDILVSITLVAGVKTIVANPLLSISLQIAVDIALFNEE